jgi:phosphatidylserine/phosphatidylglycerophosphate/cardiolipin synthase-like enzyme
MARSTLVLGALLLLAFAGTVPERPTRLTASTPAPVGSGVTSGNIQVLFTRPDVAGTGDSTINDALNALIALAAPGSHLYGSLYDFGDQRTADSLLAAKARGVNVHLVAERCANSGDTTCATKPALTALLNGLAGTTDSTDPVAPPAANLESCYRTCDANSGHSIDHNKFFVFTALTDGRTNVVATGSANLSLSQEYQHQNYVISANDPAMAAGYLDYFHKLQNHSLVGSVPGSAAGAGVTGSFANTDGRIQTYFSPRNAASDQSLLSSSYGVTDHQDLVAGFIEDVQCDPARTDDRIRIAMADWIPLTNTYNRHEITDELAKKVSQGCTVEVADEEHKTILEDLAAAGVKTYGLTPGGCRSSSFTASGDNGCTEGGTHSKYLLVQGVSRHTGQFQSYVYTGSQNYTYTALYIGNEALMRINDPTIYNGYVADYEQIKSEAVKILPNRYPGASYAIVNTDSTGNQDHGSIAVNDAGYQAVAWANDSTPAAAPGYSIYLKLSHNGTVLFEQAIATGGTGTWDHTAPDVALDSAGNAVVVWADDGDGNGSYNVHAAGYSTAGAQRFLVAPVHANVAGQQTQPRVAATPAGAFSVVWTDGATTVPHIRVASFSATGGKLSEVQVDQQTAGTRAEPDVAVDGSGNAVVVWSDDADANGWYNVHARGLTPAGASRFAETGVNSVGDGQQYQAAVAATADGAFTVAWTDSRTVTSDGVRRPRIYLRGFTATGTARYGDTIASGPYKDCAHAVEAYDVDCVERAADAPDHQGIWRVGDQSHPGIAVDSSGNPVVVWTESGATDESGSEVWARGFTAAGGTDGTRLPEYRMNLRTPRTQDEPAVAVTGTGRVTLIYDDDNDGNGSTELVIRDGFTND